MLRRENLRINREDAEEIAVQALGFIAGDPEKLEKFLALTGLGPENLRAAAQEPHFLGQIVNHIADNESLLLAFAANQGLAPEKIMRAQHLLSGPPHEREDA
ncbi:MAG: DUF3572 domain-containing protein [Beijerinckiaceae bacterium]